MSLLVPLWESLDQDKIARYVERGGDERKLAKIAAFCRFPYLREAAAKRLTRGDCIAYAAVEAYAQGHTDLVLLLTEKVEDDWLLRDIVVRMHELGEGVEHVDLEDSTYFLVFLKIRDQDVLKAFVLDCDVFSYYALERIRSAGLLAANGRELPEKEVRLVSYCAEQTGDIDCLAKVAFRSLDTADGWEKAYGQLKATEKYGERAEQYVAHLRKRDEHLQLLAQETDDDRLHCDLMNDPMSVLARAYGTEREDELWDFWYTELLRHEPNDMLTKLYDDLRRLSWCAHYPCGCVFKMVETMAIEDKEVLLGKLIDVLVTLFLEREDLRQEILLLDETIVSPSLMLRVTARADAIKVDLIEGTYSDIDVLVTNYVDKGRTLEASDFDSETGTFLPFLATGDTAKKRLMVSWVKEPAQIMAAVAGSAAEGRVWRAWLDERLSHSPNRVLFDLTHDLGDFLWPAFIDFDTACQILDTYREQVRIMRRDIQRFLSMLYASRDDLRADIMELDGMVVLVEPRERSRSRRVPYRILHIQQTQDDTIQCTLDNDTGKPAEVDLPDDFLESLLDM